MLLKTALCTGCLCTLLPNKPGAEASKAQLVSLCALEMCLSCYKFNFFDVMSTGAYVICLYNLKCMYVESSQNLLLGYHIIYVAK